MPAPIGGNQLAAADVSYSVAPSASFAAGTIYYLDETLTDYNTDGVHSVDTQNYDIETNYSAYTGWSQAVDDTVEATIDLGDARGGTWFAVQGRYGTDSVFRPTAALLEYSDDGMAWTTVDDFTGLSDGGSPGAHGWVIRWDVSGEGAHQFWRVTLTHGGQWLFVSDMEMT